MPFVVLHLGDVVLGALTQGMRQRTPDYNRSTPRVVPVF